MEMSDSEYENESDYESVSEDEPGMFYQEVSKFTCFKNCTLCKQVTNRQQIILGKRDVLNNVTLMISDYFCCDKCCRLQCLLDDYIYPFIKTFSYPDCCEVHRLLKTLQIKTITYKRCLLK